MEAAQAVVPATPQAEVLPEIIQEIQELTPVIQELTPVEITAETIPAIQPIIQATVEIPEILLPLQPFRRKRMESRRRSRVPETTAIPKKSRATGTMAIPKKSREPETTAIPKKSPAPETMATPKRSPAPEKAESRRRILHRNSRRKRMLLGWWAKPR